MRLSLITVLCLISSFCNAQRKLNFEKMSPMTFEGYNFAYAASDHDVFVVAGGNNASRYSNAVQIYDTRLDEWIGFRAKVLPAMNFASAVYMEDYNGLLLLGGTKQDGFNSMLVDKIIMMNLDDYSVKELGLIPEPARKLGIAKEGNTVYMFGGSTEAITEFTCSNKLFSYDLDKGHIEMLPDMPVAMETNGAIVENYLYVLGGFNGKHLSAVWKYDIAARQWSALPPLPEPVSFYAMAQYKQYILLVGDRQQTDQLILYDTENQKATYYKTGFKAHHRGATVVGEYLYVYGGIERSPYQIHQKTYRISMQELIQGKEQ